MEINWTELVLGVLNSYAAIALIISAVSAIAGYIFTKKPKYKVYVDRYWGTFVHAIKLAETEIPDETDNKALKRLDHALQYVITVIEAAEKKTLTDQEKVILKSTISEIHDDVEKA